jgi:hypothetical protein
MTMASRVLSTMATSSVSSAGGTWNFASVEYRSSHERGPLVFGDGQVTVRLAHGPPGVHLRPAPAQQTTP